MCAMHRIRMLHSQAYTRYFLSMHPIYNKELQQLFIAKYVSCKAHPLSYF
jgi:hypothetical protein